MRNSFLLSPMSSLPSFLTSTAGAMGPALGNVSIGIGFGKLMARFAMSLVTQRTESAPKNILRTGDGFQMARSNTITHSAKMIPVISCGRIPDDKAMSNNLSAMSVRKVPVPACIVGSCPQPASRGFVYLCPEALLNRLAATKQFLGIARSQIALAMHIAPPAPERWLNASNNTTQLLHGWSLS